MSANILVIDDNAEMAENITSILQLANYNVLIARDGITGVSIAQESHPDLILCDVMMPGLDGYGVVHILKNDPETVNTPFVFLTAKAEISDFRQGMNLGADDYVVKPFDSLELLQVVEMRLKKFEFMKASFANNSTDLNSFFNKARELTEFKKLSDNRPIRTYKKKSHLFMERQVPNELFFIEEGQVKTYKVSYDGKELITGIYGEGDFLGYETLLEEKPYSESAEVIENLRVSVIPKTDFLTLIYSSKDVARKFIKMLSNNLEEMENRLLVLAYHSVRQRVAKTLLDLDERFQMANKDTITILRRDISGLIGTATESLNRTLADFKDEGLIEITASGIKLLRKDKLEKILH